MSDPRQVDARLPSSFLPVEDQGYTITDIQLPPGASKNRTVQVVEQIERELGSIIEALRGLPRREDAPAAAR